MQFIKLQTLTERDSRQSPTEDKASIYFLLGNFEMTFQGFLNFREDYEFLMWHAWPFTCKRLQTDRQRDNQPFWRGNLLHKDAQVQWCQSRDKQKHKRELLS